MKLYCLLIVSLILFSCKKENTTVQFSGEAQGTTYQIIYVDNENNNYQREIDSIFMVIDKSMSLWDSTSIITGINKNDTATEVDHHFAIVFRRAQQVSEKTHGAFDITVAPLVKGWGFGLTRAAEMDSAMVDSLRQYVDYRQVKLKDGKIIKTKENIQIDFNAIAQGYTVDVIAEFLEQNKIKNYLIEVGGELRARGKKTDGNYWRIGIDKPLASSHEQNRELQTILELKDKSLATSGNYRKFYEKDGMKYSHTIDPATGYPVTHNLLSVSVIADNCMMADAYATAFMVMGTEKTQKFLSLHSELDAFLIYGEEEDISVWSTSGFEKLIQE
jgi:FAD:protein FMN transferase